MRQDKASEASKACTRNTHLHVGLALEGVVGRGRRTLFTSQRLLDFAVGRYSCLKTLHLRDIHELLVHLKERRITQIIPCCYFIK